jgi:phosphatidate cytidylyltransferase
MKRIITAAVLIPLIVWTVIWAPTWAFLIVTAVIGAAAFYEFDGIVAAHGIAPTKWWGIILGVIFMLLPEPGVPILVVIAAILIAWQLDAKDFSKILPSVGAAILGIVYIFGAWRCAILLRADNATLLMVPLLVSWAGDTAAMYVGKAYGKRKLASRVSPGKTQEGALASIAAGALITAIYVYFTHSLMTGMQSLIIGAITNVAGQIGDLAESALKRGANMKDSGTMLPGHGGWLDRIDSILFAIPAFYVAQQFERWYYSLSF